MSTIQQTERAALVQEINRLRQELVAAQERLQALSPQEVVGPVSKASGKPFGGTVSSVPGRSVPESSYASQRDD